MAATMAMLALELGTIAPMGVAAQQPSNLTKPRVAGVAIASEFGLWRAQARGPVGPPGGTVRVITDGFTLPDGTGFVPFAVGTPVAISGDAHPETAMVTAVSCASGGGSCSFAADFAFEHPGSFTVSSASGGLQEAINYETAQGGGLVVADPAWTGSMAAVRFSLRLPGNVMLIDETQGEFDYYGLGDGGAPELLASFSSANGVNLPGFSPSSDATRIQGQPVAAATPANGNCLVFVAGWAPGSCAGTASTAWPALSSGTNTSAAMVVGTGASLTASGAGAIAATSAPASGLTGTLTATQIAAAGILSNATTGNAATASACATADGCAPVSSVFGRTGTVTAAAGDYSFPQLSGTLEVAQLPPTVPVSSGTIIAGHCVEWATSTSIADAGAACGSGGGAGAGVNSIQFDASAALTGTLTISSGPGLNSSASGNAVVLSASEASASMPGVLALSHDLAGAYTAPQVVGLEANLANDAGAGTTLHGLATLTAAGASTAAAGATSGAVGIVTAGAGASGSASIAVGGVAACQFDATAVVAGDWVTISVSTAGDCHDAGSAKPASGEIIGLAAASGAASTLEPVLMEISW